MMPAVSCREVSKNVATGGGTRAAMSAISSSEITPGPLGIAETRPSAAAPCSMARTASSPLEIQQILTRGRFVPFILRDYAPAASIQAKLDHHCICFGSALAYLGPLSFARHHSRLHVSV